jgi:hypothetical protein
MRARPTRRPAAVQTQNHRIRNIVIGVAVALGLGGLGYLLYLSLQEPEALAGLQRFAGLSRAHDEEATYDEGTGLPPVGGVHSAVWQNCGIYDEVLDTKNVIHSLEHGAVWVTYHPDLPTADVARLQDTVRGQSYTILSPYPELRSPVVLTAWGIQLEVDSVTDRRIAEFLARYQQGPQTPELGATCQNGTGTPIG